VQGISKGKGFQGTIKRHHFHHGRRYARQLAFASLSRLDRSAPDAGPCVPGKKMSGQMGNVTRSSWVWKSC
jgi:large subunit ribosomal protein L3